MKIIIEGETGELLNFFKKNFTKSQKNSHEINEDFSFEKIFQAAKKELNSFSKSQPKFYYVYK